MISTNVIAVIPIYRRNEEPSAVLVADFIPLYPIDFLSAGSQQLSFFFSLNKYDEFRMKFISFYFLLNAYAWNVVICAGALLQ